ncbi:hypothetical protein KVT40_000521 [Elsinoe batatas]|uniref:Uncharacterized protein n=1 Tax=Elsinoe batatas TaxID=2601811 RepID=A0A8K0PIQ2_9PEZI|nr:hypothetical protein KVT40_000521 [Elsinoe batatas]
MLPPQLRASSSTGLRRPSVTSVRAIAFATQLTVPDTTLPISHQKRTFFRQRNYSWNSHLDPEYHEYHRKRHQRVRAALRDALRRRSKWQMPLPFSRVLGARAASHWSRSNLKRWPQIEEEVRKKTKSDDDYELSPGEKRWKKQMDAVKDYVDANPYRAVFGKPFDPFWSPTMWGPLVPSWAKGESGSADVAYEASPTTTTNHDSPIQDSARSQPVKPFAKTSSFAYSSTKESGKAPVIQAKASSWDSTSNEVKHLEYDPISGRMVPSKSSSSTADSLDSTRHHQASEDAGKGSMAIDLPVKRFVGDLRPASTLVRAPKARSAPAAAPQLKPVEERSSTTEKLSILPKDDIDLMTADAIRASMGKTLRTREGTTQASKPDRNVLSNDFDRRWRDITSQIEDARQQLAESKAKSSLQTTKQRGETTVQPALNRMYNETPATQKKIRKALAMLDGYSDKPMGMQTSFKQEQKACADQKQAPLAQEISNKATEGLAISDGYSQEPLGLQKTYANEVRAVAKEGRPGLEQEIVNQGSEDVVLADGYSMKPIGLQSNYANEREAVSKQDRPDIAQEIVSKTLPDTIVNDGYTTRPIGLQSNYANERKAVLKRARPDIAQEIANKTSEEMPTDDGYTTDPIGLQSNFAQEREAVAKNDRPDIAQEISTRANEEIQINDGYTTQPIGLQNSYANERKAVADQVRPDIASEIANKPSEDTEPVDGYTKEPIGLQSTYAKEREEVAKGIRPALADEMEHSAQVAAQAQSGLAGQHEDGYTNEAVGLQSSYEKEREACANGRGSTLEEELKAMNDLPKTQGKDPALLPHSLQFLTGKGYVSEAKPVDGPELQKQAAAREMFDSEISTQKQAMKMYEARHAHDAITKGEGDMDMNVARFAKRDKWYKQNNTLRKSSKGEDELVSDVVRICKENGLMQHSDYDKVEKELKDRVKTLESQIKRAASKQDELKMENGNLEAQVRQHMKQQSKLLRTRQQLSNENKELSAKLDNQQHAPGLHESALPSGFQWAEPSSYKILAYDPNNSWSSDSMQIVSTTSRFADNEVPISVPQALSSVSEPTRFVTHFAGLQKEGYQAIHASGNLLVLRKVQSTGSNAPEEVATKATQKPKSTHNTVNPVDGTARYHTETATGNYASPTGFVNHDPVFPIEKPVEVDPKQSEESEEPLVKDGVYYRHYPRVHRQEPVFSGSGKHHEHPRGRSRRHEKRASWKRRVKFAFSVGATSATLVYALGVGAELARGEKERQRREGSA